MNKRWEQWRKVNPCGRYTEEDIQYLKQQTTPLNKLELPDILFHAFGTLLFVVCIPLYLIYQHFTSKQQEDTRRKTYVLR